MMLVLALGRFGDPKSLVLTHIRRHGATSREELVRLTGLSSSSVARTVTALLDGGLVRERPDLIPDTAIGRPSYPVELDTGNHVTLGCHVGRRTTTVSLGDISGRVLARRSFPTPQARSGSAPDTVEAFVGQIARALTGLLTGNPARTVIGAGLVAPWGDIEYDEQVLGAALERRLGFPVESWELVPAIAAAEYLARSEDLPGSTMYLYSRNTVAFVMANQRPAGTEIARVGRLSHFPIGGIDVCRCGQTGCLENAVSDEAVAAKAASAGVIGTPEIELVHRAAARGDQVAHRLLCARAAALGRVAAVVRDITNPDRVVLCGQGLTGYRPALEVTRAPFAAHTATAREIGISFTRFAGDIQSIAATTVALCPVYDSPTSVLASEGGDRLTG